MPDNTPSRRINFMLKEEHISALLELSTSADKKPNQYAKGVLEAHLSEGTSTSTLPTGLEDSYNQAAYSLRVLSSQLQFLFPDLDLSAAIDSIRHIEQVFESAIANQSKAEVR